MQIRLFYPNQRGFTLLEMVVAVAIFSVISAVLYSAFKQFVEMRDQIDKKSSTLEQLQQAHFLLGNDFRYAVARKRKGEDGKPLDKVFDINEDFLIRLSTLQSSHGNNISLPSIVKWSISEGKLIREVLPRLDDVAESHWNKRVIINQIEQMELMAYYVENGQVKTAKTWDSISRLPDLIEIRFSLKDEQSFTWKFGLPEGINFALSP